MYIYNHVRQKFMKKYFMSLEYFDFKGKIVGRQRFATTALKKI